MWHGLYVHVRNVVEQVFLVRVKLKQEHEQGFSYTVFIDFFLFFGRIEDRLNRSIYSEIMFFVKNDRKI